MILDCEKFLINEKEYIRIEDEHPIWFVWSQSKEEYETVYNYDWLEKQYLELK